MATGDEKKVIQSCIHHPYKSLNRMILNRMTILSDILRAKSQRIIFSAYLPVVLLVAANLIIGSVITTDFGESWDEVADAKYGRDSLAAYSLNETHWSYYSSRKYYGPLYFMFQDMTGSILNIVLPEWQPADLRHYINFVSFQIGIIAFYLIVIKFVDKKPAFIATFLFSTQPLLFGHAFINGKDIPFMSAFLVSMAAGLHAIDGFSKLGLVEKKESLSGWLPHHSIASSIKEEWSIAPKQNKALLMISGSFLLLAVVELYLANQIVLPIIHNLVRKAYQNTAWEPINRLFQLMAQQADQIPVDMYVGKATRLFIRIRPWVILAGLIPFSMVFRIVFRQSLKFFWDTQVVPGAELWYRKRFLHLLIVSGILMGFASSIRVFGAFAGALVSIVFLVRFKERSLFPLFVYWLSAGIALYLTWPYLWKAPFENFLESLSFMINHPWRGYVLYQGEVVKGRLLPWNYLPFLIGIQFTEPVVILAILGATLFFVKSNKNRPANYWGFILLIWLVVPMLSQIVRDPWLYDNFRQFFFSIPPLLFLSAFALNNLTRRFKGRIFSILLLSTVVTPGILSIITLHPYQYVYYNNLVGGVAGASRQYELDYWCVSYKDAIYHLNEILPQNSVIAVWGTESAVKTYSRDDLKVHTFHTEEDLESLAYDVVMICTRANIDQTILLESALLAEISVAGAPLTVIKYGHNSIRPEDE